MRYFLNIRQGEHVVEDLEGTELSNLDAARLEAMEAAREILADRLTRGEKLDGDIFEICDEERRVLATVPFKQAVSF